MRQSLLDLGLIEVGKDTLNADDDVRLGIQLGSNSLNPSLVKEVASDHILSLLEELLPNLNNVGEVHIEVPSSVCVVSDTFRLGYLARSPH